MPCINARFVSQIDLYMLGSDGAIIPSTAKSYLPRLKVKDITTTDVVDTGTDLTEKLADGGVCVSAPGVKTLTGKDVEITGCGMNPALEAMFGFATVGLTGLVTTSAAYGDYDQDAAVAIQVVYKNLSDGKAWVELFPYVAAWERINPVKVDGTTVRSDGFKGRATKHGNLFTLASVAYATLPSALGTWTPDIAAINAGTKYSFGRWVDLPTQAADYGCELVAPGAFGA